MKYREEPNKLLDSMIKLREEIYEEGMMLYENWKENIKDEDFENSAKNMAFYLALRNRNLTSLQEELSTWGLSSLGRLESRTMDTIDAVISSLGKITNRDVSPIYFPPRDNFFAGKKQLRENSIRLFGKGSSDRHTNIMVTLPIEGVKEKFIDSLVDGGMNVARINCAHDGPEIWLEMINNIRKAEEKYKKEVKVLMDISGPKLRIAWILSTELKAKVFPGSKFVITNFKKAKLEEDYSVKIGLDIDNLLEEVKVGDPVLVDDGEIEGKVIEVRKKDLIVEVLNVYDPDGVNIKIYKGVNFPLSNINLDILTEKDKEDLNFACKYADIIGCSFVRTENDLLEFMKEVDKKSPDIKRPIPILAKIETIKAFENLASIIALAGGKRPFGIMIARGDLAVESGYLRLAEIQQEILWICEAADVPVVWATQVLKNMVKNGIPARAEVTDAAEGVKAECVMLNKGSHIVDTVKFLSQILKVMEENQYKKTPKLKALNIANLTFEKIKEN